MQSAVQFTHSCHETNVFSLLLLVINTSPFFFGFGGRLLGRDFTANCFSYQVLNRLWQPAYFVKNVSQFLAVYSPDSACSPSLLKRRGV